jgi:glycosyltransferase involved in cell wall biosynthesis
MNVLMGESLSYQSVIHVGSHHYADQFAADGHNVFWLGGTLHLFNLLRAWRGNKNDQELVAMWRNGPMPLRERLSTYHPMTLLPYRKSALLGNRLVLERTLAFTVPGVGAVLRERGFDRPDLLWLSQSHQSLSILKRVRYRKMAYRMSDSYAHFSNVPPSMIEAEKEILHQADVVFATARAILEEAQQIRHDVHYLPNGVDYGHFCREAPEPPDLAQLPRPRLIYVGSLRDWFDVDLLAFAARALPACAFVLIGQTQTDLSALEGLKNIYNLGPRPYATIPGYLRHSDVGLIPFKKTPLTDATNPVKLFEYFAAGLPVVSVRLGEVEFLKSPAYLSAAPDEFVEALRAACQAGRDRPEFLAFAQANSWERRFAFIKELCL